LFLAEAVDIANSWEKSKQPQIFTWDFVEFLLNSEGFWLTVKLTKRFTVETELCSSKETQSSSWREGEEDGWWSSLSMLMVATSRKGFCNK
jgi:hypothetical protein